MPSGAILGTSVITSGGWSVLNFITSQAIALSQVKAKEGELANASQSQVGAAPHRRNSLFKRLMAALVAPSMQKARCETEVHAPMGRDSTSE